MKAAGITTNGALPPQVGGATMSVRMKTDQQVCTVIIDRPERLNAVDRKTVGQLTVVPGRNSALANEYRHGMKALTAGKPGKGLLASAAARAGSAASTTSVKLWALEPPLSPPTHAPFLQRRVSDCIEGCCGPGSIAPSCG